MLAERLVGGEWSKASRRRKLHRVGWRHVGLDESAIDVPPVTDAHDQDDDLFILTRGEVAYFSLLEGEYMIIFSLV